MSLSKYRRNIFTGLLCLVTNLVFAADLRFSGALVAEPCVIDAGDEAKDVDLGNIIDRELYLHSRSKNTPFTLTLTGCSIDTATSVTITFSGKESKELTGFLATDSGSSASGMAIGMETLTGQPILLNKASPAVSLESGRTLILLRAFIQGEPTAIRDRNIINGTFSTIATFSLNYQ